MSKHKDFLSWDDDDIPWEYILQDDEDFLGEIDEEIDPAEEGEVDEESANLQADLDTDYHAVDKENCPVKSPRKRKTKEAKVATGVKKTRTTEQFACPKCKKNYKTITGFKKHVTTVHEDSSILASDNKVKPGSECSRKEPQLNEDFDMKKIITLALLPALLCVATSPFRTLSSSSFGGEVVNVANALLSVAEKARDDMNMLLCEEFEKIVSMRRYIDFGGATIREKLFTSYSMFITSRPKMTALREKVRSALGDIATTDASIHRFTACYIRQILETVVHTLSLHHQKCSMEKAKELSENDQSVLFYISGYVLRGMKYLCKRKQSKLRGAVDAIIKMNNKCDKTFVKKYTAWTQKLDRGGLTSPCDDFFLLIREFEMIVRKNVDLDRLRPDSLNKVKLTEAILDAFMVGHYWDTLCSPDYGCVKDALLEMIISKFLTVRGFAVTKHFRTKSKCSKKSEPSLRKGLKIINK